MSDSSDDMEHDFARLFCTECENHFTECQCEEE
jgi:hypothetical protein